MNSCAPNKSLGPDGFTMAFHQPRKIRAISHFHQQCHMVKSCNASFIALISRKEMGAIELRDIRPICNIGSVYRIIAKVLAERFKTVMGKLVLGEQSAFLKGG